MYGMNAHGGMGSSESASARESRREREPGVKPVAEPGLRAGADPGRAAASTVGREPVGGLDHNSPVPLHYQLKEALLDKIRRTGLRTGDRIWTEKEIELQYGVSRTTVRQALSEMVNMGIIRRQRGRGTTLLRPPIPEMLPRLAGLTEEMQTRGSVVRSDVLEAGWIVAPPTVGQALDLSGASPTVLRLIRCRYIDEEPVFYVREYLPQRLGLTPEDDFTGSLFALIRKRAGVVIDKAEITIAAVAAEPPFATFLQVAPGAPLLRNVRVFYGPDGARVCYEEEWCRSDRYMPSVTARAEQGMPFERA